ncbi:hypothetical protein Tco_0470091, partial [Tanacetum coccineum]
MKLNQKDQVVLEDSLENRANKSIVAEHGLSSESLRAQIEAQIRVRSPKTMGAL